MTRDELVKLYAVFVSHPVAAMNRFRPLGHNRFAELTRPKQCEQCGSAIETRRIAGLWAWNCSYCGSRDICNVQKAPPPGPKIWRW